METLRKAVNIQTGENISSLKDKIKTKREGLFRDVAASKITLCTVFKEFDEIKDLTVLPEPNMKSLLKIEQIFIDLNDYKVHVIIGPPPAGK